ncbi:MAG: hypothetical protein MR037_05120, partial [Bacteroidales bacterium]|nr:hypothetical protein [Bacteroidales bacterium]
YVCGLLACMSLALPASAQRYTIASISATAVSDLSEFEDGKCYLINHNGQGYLYEAEHAKCDISGEGAEKSNNCNRVKRGDNTTPTIGSVPTGKVFFVKVVTDGNGNKTYAFVGTEGTYIDNRTHNAGSPGDPMHMVISDTPLTFTLTKQTDDNNPQYWKMESTQTGNKDGKIIVDHGGTDGSGMVLVKSAGAPKIAFYEVTLVRDYMVRSVEDFKADKTYMIANPVHESVYGYLYAVADANAGHSCSVGQPRISRQDNPALVSANNQNFLFKVEAVTVGNETQYAFKHVATEKYIDNVDRGAATPGDPVHLSATQSPFKLSCNSEGLWQIIIPNPKTNDSRSALSMGPADGGGLVIYGTSGNNFAIYEVPEAPITLNSADGINGINYIGTFSAPYEAVLPEGVKAWYVSNTNNTQAVMVQAEGGQSIPANTGVILTAETAVNVIPVYDYKNNVTPVSIPANNLLHHTAAATHTAVDGDLVLGESGNVVAFYGAETGTTFALYKAYLHLDGAISLAMRFTDETTGIGQIGMETDAAKGAIYDLSGRRIAAPVKGQLYIQNGKKHIAQ